MRRPPRRACRIDQHWRFGFFARAITAATAAKSRRKRRRPIQEPSEMLSSAVADRAKSGDFRAGVRVDLEADGDLNDPGLLPHRILQVDNFESF
jgi:hypothetical protein